MSRFSWKERAVEYAAIIATLHAEAADTERQVKVLVECYESLTGYTWNWSEQREALDSARGGK